MFLRLMILSLIFTLPTSFLQATPLPARAFERAELFANCSGRLSALAAHQDAQDDENAADTRRLSAEFAALLSAVLPDALNQGVPAGQAKRWRSTGWVEIAVLLRETQYSFDQRRTDAADQQLVTRIATCKRLILPAETAKTDAQDNTTH